MTWLAAWLTLGSLVFYVVFGQMVDTFETRTRRARARAMGVLSRALYVDYEAVEPLLVELRHVPFRVLVGLARDIPLHFDDQLSRRLLAIIGATTARRRVQRSSRSRFWHRRVRAARVIQILASDEITTSLLKDSNSSVRAAVIESFGVDQVAEHAHDLLRALQDSSTSVRFTAQQALLRGDGRLVMPLASFLPNLTGGVALLALEVASKLRDPRLLPTIRSHASSEDPAVRRLVAQSISFGVPDDQLGFLVDLVHDEEVGVRVAAIEAVARLRAVWLAGLLGNAMRDRSWEVRREAGNALAQLGPLGVLVLRKTLDGDDPYAHDMARQVLDSLAVIGGRTDDDYDDVQLVDSLIDWAAA